jgi:uncharacterized membrane protein/ferredoxin-like protein FixX
MSPYKYISLILANTIGVLASVYSLLLTEKLNNFILSGNLTCDFNQAVSCSTIYISKYSFIFNLPVSLFALLFFWFVLSFLIMNRNKENHAQSYQMLSILNAVALIGCAYFLFILIFKLKSICISCLLIDTIVFSNFILLFSEFRETISLPKQAFSKVIVKNWLFHLSFIILFGCGLVLYKSYQMILITKNKELSEVFFKQEQKLDKVCTNSIFFGNKNARVKIRIFSDLNCGYCKIASEKYRQIFNNDSTTTIEFIYYPINHRKDNKKDSPKIDTFLYRVMFTASHDKEFWKFNDIIIKQIENLDSAKVFGIAEESLENFDDFKHNFSIGSQNYSLEENILLAEEYRIPGTPTIFINGREFQQWTNISLLKTIVSTIKKSENQFLY